MLDRCYKHILFTFLSLFYSVYWFVCVMSPVTTYILWLSSAPIEDWSRVKVIQAMANLVVTVNYLGEIS